MNLISIYQVINTYIKGFRNFLQCIKRWIYILALFNFNNRVIGNIGELAMQSYESLFPP